MARKLLGGVGAAVLISLIIGTAIRSFAQHPTAARPGATDPAVPVVVATAVRRDVPVFTEGVGTVRHSMRFSSDPAWTAR